MKYLLLSFLIIPFYSALANSDLNYSLISKTKDGDLVAVSEILKNGADVKTQDSQGKTALHYASFEGFVEIAKLLIEYGAYINVKDKQGNTPLYYAIEGNFFSWLGENYIEVYLTSKGARL